MRTDVSVVVGTYGDEGWIRMAQRAVRSAEAQGAEVHHVHSTTLCDARNEGLERVTTPWVVFLDADDELEPGYLDALLDGTADVRAPAVRYVHQGGRAAAPTMPKVAGHHHDCTAECLPYGNWLVIGALAPTSLIRAVDGFDDFVWSEDWGLWGKCYNAGATFEAIPQAVYRAHVRPFSRNRATRQVKVEQHNAIARANGFPEV